MNKLDKQYQDLLQDILDNGVIKGDRTGTGTISVFGRQIRHNMKDGFPLLTTKKMPFKTIVTELIWFLKGDTNIKFLVDNGCNIWNGDAYKNYIFNSEWTPISTSNGKIIGEKSDSDEIMTQEIFIDKIKTDGEFAKKWGELGPIYGKQWRKWDNCDRKNKSEFKVDQILNLVNDLKNNPDSRRLMVNAWNVGEIDDMVLPPCHYGFQLYTRELSFDERIEYANSLPLRDTLGRPVILAGFPEESYQLDKVFNVPKRAISLIWNQRSVDTFLGLPFNIASYGLLLEIIAKEVNMVPEELIGNLGDTHLYSNHIEQAKELIGRDITDEERYILLGSSGAFKAMMDDDRKEFIRISKTLPTRTREGYPLPRIKINDSWKFGSSSPVFADKLKLDMFELVDYKSHGTIKAPLSN